MKITVEPCVITGRTSERINTVPNVSGEVETPLGIDAEVKSWHREAEKMLEFARTRKIESRADLELAADDLAVIVRLKRAMAEKMQFYTSPFNEELKAIAETYRELMAPADKAERITRKKMGDCRAELEKLPQIAVEAG
jgi:hypothetical protein